MIVYVVTVHGKLCKELFFMCVGAFVWLGNCLQWKREYDASETVDTNEIKTNDRL